jgi:DNA-binding protein HU-beta
MILTDPRRLDLITLGIQRLNGSHQHFHVFDSDLSPNVGLANINTQRFFVNKTELIEHIAKHADLSKAAAGRALEATIGAVRTTLKKGGTVSLVGFGTFAVGKRAARTGRNPRTGAAIKIKKANVPKFRPGKGLKDALN